MTPWKPPPTPTNLPILGQRVNIFQFCKKGGESTLNLLPKSHKNKISPETPPPIALTTRMFLIQQAFSKWVTPSVSLPVSQSPFLQFCQIYVYDVIRYLFSHQLALQFLFILSSTQKHCWFQHKGVLGRCLKKIVINCAKYICINW